MTGQLLAIASFRDAAVAMGSVVVTWLLLAALLTGMGSLAYRCTGVRVRANGDLFIAFWLG